MRKKKELFDIVRDMEYTDAVTAVEGAINSEASRVATKGGYSREAVEKAEMLLAAWLRVQRG